MMVVMIGHKKNDRKNERQSTQNLQHSPDNPRKLLVGI
jgi:hypothetical protein